MLLFVKQCNITRLLVFFFFFRKNMPATWFGFFFFFLLQQFTLHFIFEGITLLNWFPNLRQTQTLFLVFLLFF